MAWSAITIWGKVKHWNSIHLRRIMDNPQCFFFLPKRSVHSSCSCLSKFIVTNRWGHRAIICIHLWCISHSPIRVHWIQENRSSYYINRKKTLIIQKKHTYPQTKALPCFSCNIRRFKSVGKLFRKVRPVRFLEIERMGSKIRQSSLWGTLEWALSLSVIHDDDSITESVSGQTSVAKTSLNLLPLSEPSEDMTKEGRRRLNHD